VIEKQLITLREEETDRGHRRLRLEVVVGRLHLHAARAPARERPHLDGRLGIQRDPQHLGIGISCRVDRAHLREDGVGLGDLFWGCVLATRLRV
jgi:hypothetical protein